jgi:hypothetical protein
MLRTLCGLLYNIVAQAVPEEPHALPPFLELQTFLSLATRVRGLGSVTVLQPGHIATTGISDC